MAQFSDSCGCNAVLIQDFQELSLDSSLELHILNTITEATYSEIKGKDGGGGSIGWGNFSFGLDASFEDFQQQRRDYFQQEQFDVNQEVSFKEVRRKVSSEAIAAWRDCSLACINSLGLNCAETNVDDDSVSLVFRWNSPPGVGEGKVTHSTLIGGSVTDNDVPVGQVFKDDHTFPSGAEIARTFRREPEQDFDLSVEVNGGYSCEIHIPAPTPPKVEPPIVILAKNFVNPLNVALSTETRADYGADVLHNAPPYNARPNAAEWVFAVPKAGEYKFETEYASAQNRPVTVSINGAVVRSAAMNPATGGWEVKDQSWNDEGQVTFPQGEVRMRVERGDVFPYIRAFRFTELL